MRHNTKLLKVFSLKDFWGVLERHHFIGGEKSLSQTASPPRRLDRFQGLTLIFLQLASHSNALMQVMTDTSAKRKSIFAIKGILICFV